MFVVAVGLQEATTVVIGNAIGDNNSKLAKRYFKVTCQIGFGIFFGLAYCVWFWRKPITELFTNEPGVIELSIATMYVLSIKHIFDLMQCYLQRVIRGLALQRIGAYIALITAYPIQIPLAIMFAFKMQMGIAGLWWADAVGMATQMIMFFFLICMSDWEKITEEVVARIEMESKELEANEFTPMLISQSQ